MKQPFSHWQHGLAAVFRHYLMEAIEPGVRNAAALAEACHDVVFDRTECTVQTPPG
jgi:hypothetical protein